MLPRQNPCTMNGVEAPYAVTGYTPNMDGGGVLFWAYSQGKIPELYGRIHRLLKDKLERGNMVPFYKIGQKMRSWMKRNGIREISSATWYDRYYQDDKPFLNDGYCGVIYKNDRRARKGSYSRDPHSFYLELPIELVEKVLALGYLP